MEKFMQCTDAWRYNHTLLNHMLIELKLAIQAHGGEYSWYSEEDEEYEEDTPVVLCNREYGGPVDIKVRRVYIDERGYLGIDAVTNEYEDEVQIEIYEIVPHHIQFIIESIPATNELSDVSMPLPLPNESYLNILQEMTLEVFTRTFMQPMANRYSSFDMIRTWTHSFVLEKYCVDWEEDTLQSKIREYVDTKMS